MRDELEPFVAGSRSAGSPVARIEEIFGPGSTVVGPEATDVAIWSEAETLLALLGGHAVSLENLELVEEELDWVFENHLAVAIRPDRYIFGVVDDDWSLDDLLLELGKKLALR